MVLVAVVLAHAHTRARHMHAGTRALHGSVLTHVYTGFVTPRQNVIRHS